MKHILFGVLLAAFTVTAASAHNEPETATIKVFGACAQCEIFIEKAAKLPGVTSAEWNIETKNLTVSYDKEKTNLKAVRRSIAAAGFDTDRFSADPTAAGYLPVCCQPVRKRVPNGHEGHNHSH